MFHDSVAELPLAPPRPQPIGEALGLLRGVATLPTLVFDRPPRGDGGVVRVLPGYLTGDTSTIVLRAYLRRLGYRALGWQQGVNRGDVAAMANEVAELVQGDSRRSGRPVRIVGWSLGGVIGREVARLRPQDVAHVVTLGSPVVGGPKYTAAATSYRSDGWDLESIAALVAQRNAVPMPVPVTALYSRQDSVVAWQACLDPNRDSPTRHVEVAGKHAELGVSPAVLRLVARALAEGS